MLTKRQNLLETIRGGNPDRFVKQYEAFAMQIPNGFSIHNPSPKPGQMNVVNAWGVTRSWPAGMPGAFPVHTPDKIVIKDIEEWEKYLKVPQVKYDAQVWEPFIAAAEAVDRNEYFCTSAVFPGVFEMSHYLTEIQNCLMAFYEYPDEMHGIIDAITQFEMDLAAEICKYIKPDALFHHDDWGSQISTFMSPDMFREFIKPAYEKIYGYYKSHGVELIIHHSDTPGAIANVTGVISAHKINIANLQAFRRKAGGDALIVLELDGVPDEDTISGIRAFPEVQGVTFLVRRCAV